MGIIKRYFRLLKLYARLDLNWITQDTRNCLLAMGSDLLTNLASVSGVFLLAMRFDGVGGLTADEMLWMLGFFSMGEGLVMLFFMGNNVSNISRRVGRGQVDHMLIQPLSLPMQLLTEGFLPFSGSGCLIGGIAVTVIAQVRAGIPFSWSVAAMAILYLLCRMAIVLGASYAAGASAFYRPVEMEEISSLVLDMFDETGKYPLGGLSRPWTIVFTTVLPVGLSAYLPGMVLLGKTHAAAVMIWPVVVAAVFLSVGIVLFRKGLAHYAHVGSKRYRALGHRS